VCFLFGELREPASERLRNQVIGVKFGTSMMPNHLIRKWSSFVNGKREMERLDEINARSRLSTAFIRNEFQAKLRTRITHEEVVEIFLYKQSEKSPTVVSRLCGVSEKTVRDIWSGRTWSKETKHLDPSRAVCRNKLGRLTGNEDMKPRKPRGKLIKMMGEEKGSSQGGIGWSQTGPDRTCLISGIFTSSTGILIDIEHV
jgi:hypothetical protein